MAGMATLSFPNAETTSINAGGVLAILNGKEQPRAYDPAMKDVRSFGLWCPDTELTAAVGTGGSLVAGSYTLTYVEVNTKARSGLGLVSGPPRGSDGVSVDVADGGTITVTLPAGVTNPDADERWVYMTIEDGVWPTLGRVEAVATSVLTVTIDGGENDSAGPDFDGYPLDIYRNPAPNKTYSAKINRRLMFWGAQELDTDLSMTVGSTEAFYESGDALDRGCIGMVAYPDGDGRGYLITDWTDGSPYSITLKDAFVGTEASQATSTIRCKICRPSGELSWSEPDDYENVPAANVRYIELSAADPETGCGVIGGRCLLFSVQKVWALDFDTLPGLGWGRVSELSTDFGCLSHRTIQDIGGALLFLSEAGIGYTAGGQPQIISDEIRPEFETIIREATGRCRAAFAVNWSARQQYLCFVPQDGDSIGCSKCLVVNYATVPGEPKFRFSIYTFEHEFTFGSVERHTATIGDTTSHEKYPVLGDADGYTWSFGSGNADGPESGTVSGTVTDAASSPNYLEDTSAAMYTTGLALAGMYLKVRRQSDGTEQTKRIETNSETRIYPTADWDWLPVAGDTWWVGGIESRYETAWSSLGGHYGRHKLYSVIGTYSPESSGSLSVSVYQDFSSTAVATDNEGTTFDLSESTGRGRIKLSGSTGHYTKVRFHNYLPDQPWTLKDACVVWEEKDEPR